MNSLKSQMNRGKLIKCFESYPICFMGEDDVSSRNYPEAENSLTIAVRELHKISDGFGAREEYQKKYSHLFKVISREDLSDIKMFLTEVLWALGRHKFLITEKYEGEL